MSTDPRPPVLELDRARVASDQVWADAEAEGELPAIGLRLDPGELALVEVPDQRWGRALAALCAGLPPLAEGSARFLGQDWSTLRRPQAEALRGRIGHIFAENGGWLPHLSVAQGILLPRLHHDRTPEATLRRSAVGLAHRFRLDDLPEGRPAELPPLDLARAACARAFLGEPSLLLLESPFRQGQWIEDLAQPLLTALTEALDRGAACLWLASRRSGIWDLPGLPGSRRYRLSARGLQAVGDAGRGAA